MGTVESHSRYDLLGGVINHKRVQRLMSDLGLKSTARPKRYRSYQGHVGRLAPDLLKKAFTADNPNQKWVTDVTEFKVSDQKVYLPLSLAFITEKW